MRESVKQLHGAIGPVLLGINHHLLFPESFTDQCVHEETLVEVAHSFPEFQVIDCFLNDDPERREREIAAICGSGKKAVYNLPLFGLMEGVDPSSPNERLRKRAVELATEHVRRAKQLPTLGIVIASGTDPGEALRGAHTEAFVAFLTEVAAVASPLPLMIEPFDRSVDKRLLVGPTREAVSVIETLRARNVSNVFLMVDMGHLPLMEESFTEALRLSAPHLRHVHLGSCVKDPDHPMFGDTHPPMGMEGGVNGEPELERFLLALQGIGYLNGALTPRPTVTLEQRPYPGMTERESVDVWMQMLCRVWPEVI